MLSATADHVTVGILSHVKLSSAGRDIGPGFAIRFTVQYNLFAGIPSSSSSSSLCPLLTINSTYGGCDARFAGTILALGSPQQVARLRDSQTEGRLGCFALTEKLVQLCFY